MVVEIGGGVPASVLIDQPKEPMVWFPQSNPYCVSFCDVNAKDMEWVWVGTSQVRKGHSNRVEIKV